ncbi:transporter substrate-binding domain-containing protein [Microbulbifer marinus]|uniref:transporter substrate-binding domain-containing protein n=1 Tax=Microbulbifer marinus TaxID=658218 RepID=UPI00147FFBC3|nr:transporter substrate-binding domain-containing protein [Microbulbifer marinus]
MLVSVLILAVAACGKQERPVDGTQQPERRAEVRSREKQQEKGQDKKPRAARDSIDRYYQFTNYTETGDLRAIREHGTIRFVNLTGASEDELPREGVVTLRHFELANKLAKQLKLEPKWIRANTPDEAIELLLAGKADILAYNLTDTEARRERINYSVPLRQSRQKLVTGSNGPDISDPDTLQGVEFIVPAGSSNIPTAQRLIEEHPDANLSMMQVTVYGDRDILVDLLNKKDNRVAILDDYIAEDLASYRDDLRIGAAVSETENIAWGLRKDSKLLLTTVNNFLTRNLVKKQEERFADWDAIKKAGVIRLLTYNGPTTYFLWKGLLMGFDYDLAKAFADKHRLQLQVIVVPYEEDLTDWLKAGRGDFAGASLAITEERQKQGVAFTTSYMETPERIVSNEDRPPIEKVQDLAGRTLTLRAYSSFIPTAMTIKNSGIDVEVKIAPPGMSISRIFNLISDGLLDATIADDGEAKIEASLRPNLITGTLLGDPKPQGWMVVTKNWHLLQNLNKFIKDYRKTEKYQQDYNAYFKPNKRFTQRVRAQIIPGKDLSPYDDLVKASALNYDFDWRMVVAQMWQESNFNPKAVSPVGAQGLMQVMPATAKEMGFPPPLFEPERGIKAGVKYLDWVRDRFAPTLPTANKLWFTLASYNAGYGHLLDAQRLAEELGLDPNVWFGNVEEAMLKLAEPRYFKKARYGYVRGSEPVQYVRNISNLYKAYVEVATGEISVRPPLQKKPKEEPSQKEFAIPLRKSGSEEQISE